MQKLKLSKPALLTMLFILINNLLRGVSDANSASISHHHINNERFLADDQTSQDVMKIDCGCEADAIAPGYISDASLIDSGKNMYIQPQYYYLGMDPVLRTVRSFPQGKRNCYTFNPSGGSGNSSYLIQLRFKYGNYDQRNVIPIFDVYIGVDLLDTVNLNSYVYELFIELIYKPKTDAINICFVNIDQGIPFISEIFIRRLNSSTIYDTTLGALLTSSRYDFLSFSSSAYKSYKRVADDPYGRFWAPVPSNFQNSCTIPPLSKEITSITNDRYEIPASILQSRIEPRQSNNSLVWLHTPTNPTEVGYFYWHFFEIEKFGKGKLREYTISMVGNNTLGPIRPAHLKALTVVSPPLTLESGDSKFWFTINKTGASTLPPILNALEYLTVVKISHMETNQNDVKAIMDVKTNYPFITGWQADPCLPKVPWDGLICSSDNNETPRITSLNLSSKGLTGEILPSLSGLTSLINLDLSHNALNGMIPEFLAKMPSLKVLNLSGNNLSGSVPVALTDKVKTNFLSLRLDDNPYLCTSNSCGGIKSKHHILTPLVASLASLFVVLFIAVFVFIVKRRKRVALNTSDGGMKLKNQQFTYSEVIRMTNNFQRVLGKGAYGTVYHGYIEGNEVAVKMLNQPSALVSFQTEAELLTRVHHKNLVSLIGYCNEGDIMSLIYEYMASGNLEEHLSGDRSCNSTLTWKQRLQIAIDAAQGLDYLHNGSKPAIVHRDLKTSNVLLDSKLQAKLADFGVSKIFATESASHISTEHVVGTPGYLDPEYHSSYRLNEKSDVYSFGVILLELITGKPPIIRDLNESIHISSWVMPLLQKGEIQSIIDQRLIKDFSINSAWKFLEIAVSCVPSMGIQRPTMAQVYADLKECLTLELVHEKAKNGLDLQPPVSSTYNTFQVIQVDNEANMGPKAR